MLSTRLKSNFWAASGTASFLAPFYFYSTIDPFLIFNPVFLICSTLEGISATDGAPRDDLEFLGSKTGTNFGFFSFKGGCSMTSLTTAFDFLKLSLFTTGLVTFKVDGSLTSAPLPLLVSRGSMVFFTNLSTLSFFIIDSFSSFLIDLESFYIKEFLSDFFISIFGGSSDYYFFGRPLRIVDWWSSIIFDFFNGLSSWTIWLWSSTSPTRLLTSFSHYCSSSSLVLLSSCWLRSLLIILMSCFYFLFFYLSFNAFSSSLAFSFAACSYSLSNLASSKAFYFADSFAYSS